EQLRREGDCLSVIARRRRHDAARTLVGRQLREKVVCAAELERSTALQHFRFDEHRHTDALRDGVRRKERRAYGNGGEHPSGGLELADGYQLHVNQENTRFRPAVFALYKAASASWSSPSLVIPSEARLSATPTEIVTPNGGPLGGPNE